MTKREERHYNHHQREKNEIHALKTHLLQTIPQTTLRCLAPTTAHNNNNNNDNKEEVVQVQLGINSIALKAAIAGLDKEWKRLDREEKLMKRFSNNNGGNASNNTSSDNEKKVVEEDDDDVAMEYVKMSKDEAIMIDSHNNNSNSNSNHNDDEDWQDAKTFTPTQDNPDNNDATANTTTNTTTNAIDDATKNNANAAESSNWASHIISRIAKSNVRVATPLGAVALALHAALMELTGACVGGGGGGSNGTAGGGNGNDNSLYRCTGIPTELVATFSQQLQQLQQQQQQQHQEQSTATTTMAKKSGGGFAPPIRELPKGTLVPHDWETTSTNNENVVAFRYKQVATGATVYLVVVLLVLDEDKNNTDGNTNNNNNTTMDQQQVVKVSLFGGNNQPSLSSLLQEMPLAFPLGRHVNLDGFHTAISNAKNNRNTPSSSTTTTTASSSSSVGGVTISPSLFYKSLSNLVFQFGSTFHSTNESSFSLLSAMHATFGKDDGASFAETMNGVVEHEGCYNGSQSAPIYTMQIPYIKKTTMTMTTAIPHSNIPSNGPSVTSNNDPTTTNNNPSSLRAGEKRHGDFEGDLLPGGPQPGLLIGGVGGGGSIERGGGSQVGPNHPLFDRTFGEDYGHNDINNGDDDGLGYYGGGGSLGGVPGVGGMGMRPRYVHRFF